MAINVFEGGRRFAKLLIVLWLIGWCISAIISARYIHATYLIYAPETTPSRIEGNCDFTSDATEYVNRKTTKGTNAFLTLCFAHKVFEDGERLIPYRIDKNTKEVVFNAKHSTEVLSYTKSVARSFDLSKSDEAWIDARWWPLLKEHCKENAGWIFGGAVFIWIFSWVLGWIVRGFAGIPTGSDKRPEA